MSPHRSDHLIRHSLLLLAASQATNFANTLFHMFMGRMLAPIEYGTLASMLGLLMIVAMPLSALSNSLAFYSAKFIEAGEDGAIVPFMRQWLLKVAFIAVLTLIGGAVLCPVATAFFRLQRPATFIITTIVLAISFFGPMLGGILQGVQAFVWGAVSAIVGGFLRVSGAVILIFILGGVSDLAVIGHGLGMLVSLAVGVAGVLWIFRNTTPAPAQKSIAAYFFWTLLVLAGFSVMMNADVLIVKHYFLPETSGVFARAATIGRIIVFLPMPIAGALFPKAVAAGSEAVRQKKLLWRGILFAGGIIMATALGGSLLPQLPLWILYGDYPPAEATVTLVRCMLWAMSPLSLAYIIMNYHLAQHRFGVLLFLPAGALLYLAGATLWHASVLQIIAVLAAVNILALVVLIIGLPWNVFRFRAYP